MDTCPVYVILLLLISFLFQHITTLGVVFAEVYIYITTGPMYSIIYACVNTFILQVAIVQNSLV